eukprot:COSAG06_NODE_37633_length_433_cov_0.473054_1_plen_23_part_01
MGVVRLDSDRGLPRAWLGLIWAF